MGPPTLRGPTLLGPTLRGVCSSMLFFISWFFCFCEKQDQRLQHQFWPKSVGLAKVGLAKVGEKGWPKSVWPNLASAERAHLLPQRHQLLGTLRCVTLQKTHSLHPRTPDRDKVRGRGRWRGNRVKEGAGILGPGPAWERT